MYQITQTPIAGRAQVTIKEISTGNYASIIAGYGGALNELVISGKSILYGAANDAAFETVIKGAYAGAQLFPYVNRVNNAQFSIGEQQYFLPQNDDAKFPHALHGLIYNQPFTIESTNESIGELVLVYHFHKNETLYPFEFFIKVTYTLLTNGLMVQSSITNMGDGIAPMSYGWHPYIKVTGTINNCQLHLPASIYYITNDVLIPTGEKGALNSFQSFNTIADAALNQCFEMPNVLNEHTTTLIDTDETQIQLIQKGFNYTQYYIPPDRKSIAIEPQTAIANAINNGIGLINMQPDEVKDCSFKIIVSIPNK